MKIKKLTFKTLKLALVFSIFGAFSSCSKDGIQENQDGVAAENAVAGKAPCVGCQRGALPNVYVGGSTGYDFQATQWLDGTLTNLPVISGESYVQSIFVKGSDVYKAGRSGGNAVYWKNNTRVSLDASGFTYTVAKSIYVSGTDVYVVGYGQLPTSQSSFPVVWKNGVRSYLEVVNGDNRRLGEATSVFVKGNDVYIVGFFREVVQNNSGPGPAKAKLWKNGNSILLNTTALNSYATSVYVDAIDNVYISGFGQLSNQGSRARYWKNGVEYLLSTVNNANNSIQSYANSIFVYGIDVHVAGNDGIDNSPQGNTTPSVIRAKYWKNGVETLLTNGTNPAMAKSIFVKNTKVYIVGWENTQDPFAYDNGSALLWTNGVKQVLSTNLATANSVFVQ